jgi:hypothetical protein
LKQRAIKRVNTITGMREFVILLVHLISRWFGWQAWRIT